MAGKSNDPKPPAEASVLDGLIAGATTDGSGAAPDGEQPTVTTDVANDESVAVSTTDATGDGDADASDEATIDVEAHIAAAAAQSEEDILADQLPEDVDLISDEGEDEGQSAGGSDPSSSLDEDDEELVDDDIMPVDQSLVMPAKIVRNNREWLLEQIDTWPAAKLPTYRNKIADDDLRIYLSYLWRCGERSETATLSFKRVVDQFKDEIVRE